METTYPDKMASATSSRSNPFSFRQCEALLRNTMDEAGIGMLIVGTDGELIYVNQALGDMLGRQPDECVGMVRRDGDGRVGI
jgi:PAS domain-containing protein